MKDKDFDNIFNHKFGQLPGEPYREEGWSELSGRLDMHKRLRRRWFLPVLLPLFGLMAAGNAFWWYQWREAVGHNGASFNQATAAVVHTDTIVRTTVVYRYDTIYRYAALIPDRPALRAPGASEKLVSDASAAAQNLLAGSLSAQQAALVFQNQQDAVQQREKQDAATASAGHAFVRKALLADTAAQAGGLSTTPAAMPADSLFEQLLQAPPKTPRAPLVYLARPRLGVSAGWGSPGLPHKRSGSVFGFGLGADVEIARRLRLGADVNYLRGSLKADETDALRGVDIPDPGSDFRLRYWETYRLPALTYALHLRCAIPTKKNWTPWFGAGAQAITVLPFDIEFDFENQTNNLELFLPAQAKAMSHWQGFLLMAGLEGRIGPRLSLGAEGFLLRRFDRRPSLLDNQAGVKTRLFYTF